MAELKVEPKSSTPWWIWLIVALVIIVALFFIFGDNDEMDTDENYPGTETPANSPGAAIVFTPFEKEDLNTDLYAKATEFKKTGFVLIG